MFNDDYIKAAADDQALKDKVESYSNANKQNQELNDEHRRLLSKFYDNIALYSAGAISFSTTIIGLVLANYPQSLANKLLIFPNIYYLYVSWTMFAIAFSLSLFAKRFDAYYISSFGFANWTKKYYEMLEEQTEFTLKNPDRMVVKDTTLEASMKIDRENIQKLKQAHITNESKSKRYFGLVQISHRVAEIAAPLGLIFLILFTVLLTQSVVGAANKPQTTSNEINLEYKTTKVINVDEQTQKNIEAFIGTFYKYQQNREVDNLLGMFTPPSNPREQDDLDFLLGKDLARVDAKLQTRLFTTQGYNYTIGGFYIREISKQNGTTSVLVDEMRTLYSGGESVGYTSKNVSLALQIVQTPDGLKVVKYNHTIPSNVIKYDGFIAN
jgi:hypothetical protein